MFGHGQFALTAVARRKMLQNGRRLNVMGITLSEATRAQVAGSPPLGYPVAT